MKIDTAVPVEKLRRYGKRLKTMGLFWENRHLNPSRTKDAPVYNMSKFDHNDTLSMYNIYMSYDNEYDAAMRILGDWEHWQTLCGNNPFMRELEKWRKERETREEAMAHSTLMQAAESGNVAAARTILLESKKVNMVGRPATKDVEKARQVQADLDSFLVHSIGKAKK